MDADAPWPGPLLGKELHAERAEAELEGAAGKSRFPA
jgi:hypothetical protein